MAPQRSYLPLYARQTHLCYHPYAYLAKAPARRGGPALARRLRLDSGQRRQENPMCKKRNLSPPYNSSRSNNTAPDTNVITINNRRNTASGRRRKIAMPICAATTATGTASAR